MAIEYYYASKKSDKKNKGREVYNQPQVLTAQTQEPTVTTVSMRRLSWVILALALGYVCWWLLYSSYFEVRYINYLQEPSERVKARIESLKGENIILMRPTKLARQWEVEQPSIKALHIYRGFPQTLRVAVEERSKAFIWQTQGKSYLLDASGVVFEEVPSPSDQNSFAIIDDNNVTLTLGQKITSEAFVKTVQSILDELQKYIGDEGIKNMHVSETIFNVTVVTGKDIKIMFDTTQPLDLQLEAVKKVYAENRGDVHEYLDVRVLGKAYLK